MKRYALFLLLSLCIPAGLFAQASATDFGYSYALLPKGNQTSILLDGTIIFPDTTVNVTNPAQSQINSATFVITNRGANQGIVSNITAGGTPAQFRTTCGGCWAASRRRSAIGTGSPVASERKTAARVVFPLLFSA